jgi:hypothetical protein
MDAWRCGKNVFDEGRHLLFRFDANPETETLLPAGEEYPLPDYARSGKYVENLRASGGPTCFDCPKTLSNQLVAWNMNVRVRPMGEQVVQHG